MKENLLSFLFLKMCDSLRGNVPHRLWHLYTLLRDGGEVLGDLGGVVLLEEWALRLYSLTLLPVCSLCSWLPVKNLVSQTGRQWCIPLISALRRQRQVDFTLEREFQNRFQSYTEKTCFEKSKNKQTQPAKQRNKTQ